MFERVLNLFWIVLGVGAAVHARSLGITGPSGPESGLFPMLAGLLVAASGVVLLVRRANRARPEWPRGAALLRIGGVVAGLAFIAGSAEHIGFAAASGVTMLVLLRSVERTGWIESLVITFAAVALVLWLFGHVLGMPLPRGPWGW